MIDHGIYYSTAAKYELGLVTAPLIGHERFAGCLAIPYRTPGGIAAIKFRRLGEGKPKYDAPDNQKQHLYNVAAYFAADDVIGIAEGEIDAISATETLGLPTIGVPGAQVWTAHAAIWAPIFKDFRRVVMFADGDAPNAETGKRPGRELAKTIAASVGWRVTTIECPEGYDVSSMTAAGRAGELIAKWHLAVRESDDGDTD